MSDMPDFDNMSDEEMQLWMESLAKRQGATEGFMTNADMEVDEVDESDERLAGQGEYIPHGWSKEKWEAHLAKEEEEKQRKAAEKQAQPEPPPEIEPDPVPEPAAEVDTGLSDDMEEKLDAAAEGDMPDFENMTPEEAMRFMESLAKRQGATEGFTTTADMEVGEVDESDERLAGQGEYIPHGWSKEKWEAHLAKEEEEKQRKAAAQQQPASEEAEEAEEPAAADTQMPDILSDMDMEEIEDIDAEADTEEAAATPDFDDIFGSDNELPALDSLGDEATPGEETQPAAAAGQDPMDWLSGLEEDEDDADALDLDALGELEGAGASDDEGDPMDWLAGLAGDEDEDELDFDMGAFDDMDMDMGFDAEPEATASDEPEAEPADEGSLEWMESLAKRQGADSEELVTDASMDIPEPDDTDEGGPGYEPYSFESGTGGTLDETDEDDESVSPPVAEFDTEQLDLDDPESWLDSLASGVSEASAGADDEMTDDEDDLLTEDVTSKLRSGEDVSEEEIQSFFEAQFRRADKRDVPDYLDEEELEDFEGFDVSSDESDTDDELVEADIPEWLRESMEQEPPTADADTTEDKTATAEMMVADLGLDDELDDDDAEFPDWLAGTDEEDSGDISDIFAEETADTGVTETEMPDDMDIDTDDSWVAAFSDEDSGELADWYERERARLEGEDVPDEAASEEPAAGLQPADLPMETELPQGQPQVMPGWMGSAAAADEQPGMEAESIEEDMDWLDEEDVELATEDDIPDWLREDTVTEEEGVPDWLSEEEVEMATEDVPDWLRETMEDEQEVISAQQLPEPDEPKLPEPDTPKLPESQPAQPSTAMQPAAKSPAPVSASAADIDIDSTLAAARESVSRDAVDEALVEYERLIRANAALEEVERDITKLTEKHKKNPAVFRLLGDTLMRRGKLQQALDTYRRALNML
jgi:hypothetical protein